MPAGIPGGEAGGGTRERRPMRGAAACHGKPGLPSVHLYLPSRPVELPGSARLPRLVARGYLAAVPGRSDVRTTVLTRNPEPEKTLA